jgi:hypothetical protein
MYVTWHQSGTSTYWEFPMAMDVAETFYEDKHVKSGKIALL